MRLIHKLGLTVAFMATSLAIDVRICSAEQSFTDIGAGLPGVPNCSLAWGDYDNDGDLDLALAGYNNSGRISRIYRNDGGVFTDISAGLPGVGGCSLAWGDYGNDGDLDLALAGFDANSNPISRIYRNVGGTLNTAPAAPSGLTAAATGFGELTLNWNAASDSETPSAGLSYNVRVGTSPGAQDVFSGMADLSTGLRRIPATGNAQKRLSWTLESVPCGMVWWSVQAIDTAFAGSAWSVEQSVAMPSAVRVDFDGDCDVDSDDLDTFKSCASGPLIPHSGTTTCQTADLDEDNDVDQEDFAIFQRCISGKNNPADPNCAN